MRLRPVHIHFSLYGLFIILLLFPLLGKSQIYFDTDTSKQVWNPFTYEASYVGDAFNNLHGGVKRGSGYLGMGNFRIALDTKEAGWWKGGVLFLNAAATHGKSPSEYVGDFQVVSNIDAGDHMFIQELWYKQSFSTFDCILGLQDMNAEFLTSEGGGQFMNSSFGVPSVISDNVPAPIFPLTTLGVEVKWNISDQMIWQSAIYDGNPTAFDHNTYNLDWQIKKEDGALLISEFQYLKPIFKRASSIKAGLYYHSRLQAVDDSTSTLTSVFNNNQGLYAIIDQTLWYNTDSTRVLGYFVQAAASPRQSNTHNYYLGGGLTFRGIFKKRINDVIGIAVANAAFHNFVHKHELALEFNYKFELTENIYVQPNIQYLINPAGTDNPVENAVIGFVRFGLRF
jgi:porin